MQIKYQILTEARAYVRESDGEDAKARRAVRSNNFTQQTNTLDVDKHMQVKFKAESRNSDSHEMALG